MQKFLKNFYDLTIRDPLFSAEGLDLDNAGWALEELQDVSRKLQTIDTSLTARTYFFVHPLSEILHPFRFLKAFLSSERTRRHFLASPNLENAKTLIQTYYTCVNSLEKDLKVYWSACIKVQERTFQKRPLANAYNFFGNKLTFDQFNACIELMLENVSQLRRDINNRNKLLLTSIARAILPVKKERSSSVKARLFSESILAAKIGSKKTKIQSERINWIQGGRDYIYFLKQRFGEVTPELFGPITYKLQQFDKKETTHKFLISFIKDSAGRTRFASAILADQFHFLELERDKYKFYADIFTYESLIKQGIKYWYQPATSFYFTSDLTYYPDLLTAADLSIRPNLIKESLLREKSSLLDLLLWNGYIHNLSYLQNIQSRKKAGRKLGSWHYLLIGRGYPSLYYLTYNQSVWRLKETPDFYGSVSRGPSPYITLDKLPKSLNRTDLRKIFMGGIIRAEEIDAGLSDS